jgi:hypothetical protein
MTEAEYIQVENLTSLRVIKKILEDMIADDVYISNDEITYLYRNVYTLIKKYEGLKLEPNA